MKLQKVKAIKIFVAILFALMLAISSVYVFYLFSLISYQNDGYAVNARSCSHHVLVLGDSEDETFLTSIYEGAKTVGNAYDSVVELYVPKNYTEKKSLQSLFDYASFINPDGIITCISGTESKFDLPVNRKGELIPLITLAQYHPELPQVTYIGTNYSELGRKIALESSDYLLGYGRLGIINIAEDSGPNYSTLMNSLTNTLANHHGIQTSVFDFNNSETISSSGETIKKLILNKSVDLLVCLTTEDTIRIAQLVTELNRNGQIGIIGFGSGEILETYLNKGTVTELLSIDSEKIGRIAMKELFEYIRRGYANNYIAAEVRVKRSGIK